jgi:hypothetical protein
MEKPPTFEELKTNFKNEVDKFIFENNPFLKHNFSKIKLVATQKEEKIQKGKSFPSKLDYFPRALFHLFDRVLGMWEAGKSKKEIYEEIYAYPDKGNEDYLTHIHLKDDGYEMLDIELNNIPVNLDKEYIEKFIIELCGRAIEIRDTKCDIYNSKISRFFLIGDIGTGKTTFLNNLFSQYHEKLKDKEVIWVRVDLTKPYHRKRKLLDALNFQRAKIFRGHYSDNFNADFKNLMKYLKDAFIIYDRDKSFNKEVFDNCKIDYLSKYDKDRTDEYDKRIQFGIKRYIENNYGVIYIFDGLDKLTVNENFNERIAEIKEILYNEKIKGVFIFVMRNKSHFELFRALQNEEIEQTHLRGQTKILRILPPKLSEILDKRISILVNRSSTFLSEKRTRILPNKFQLSEADELIYKNISNKVKQITVDQYNAYLNIFFRYLHKGISVDFDFDASLKSWKREHALTELKNLVGENFRKLLNIINLSNKAFLETINRLGFSFDDILDIYNSIGNPQAKNFENYKEKLESIFRRDYLIVEIIVRRNKYFENPYSYEYSINKKIQWSNKELDPEDIPYIYNLFYSVNVQNVVEEKYYLTIKIRILQYILNSEKIYNKEKIIDHISEYFGYGRDHIELALEELFKWHLIMYTPEVVYDKFIPRIILSRAGRYHLEHLIGEFNYLRLILDDIIIPEEFLQYFQNYSGEDDNKTNVKFYISQFPRVINFIAMLFAFELKEISESKRDDTWLIFPDIYDKLIDTFARILIKSPYDLKYVKNVLSKKGIS